jgi:hypothetical protein
MHVCPFFVTTSRVMLRLGLYHTIVFMPVLTVRPMWNGSWVGCDTSILATYWYVSQKPRCDVYFTASQARKVEVRRPYQSPAIISTISAFFFVRSSDILRGHQEQFASSEEGSLASELPDTMIASASTAVSPMVLKFVRMVYLLNIHMQVYAGLSEWRSGRHQHLDFSVNTFASVYTAHIALLARIQEDNPHGYHLLKAKLFTLAQ